MLRYFNVAGADPEGDLPERHEPETHLIPLAIDAATGYGPPFSIFGTDYPTADGTCERDFIHVSDLAAAHVEALRHLNAGSTSLAINQVVNAAVARPSASNSIPTLSEWALVLLIGLMLAVGLAAVPERYRR